MENYGMVNTRVRLGAKNGVHTQPASWDSLTDLCNDVYQRINAVIPSKKRLVIYFAFRGSKYRLKLDFSNINAKAATVVCVIGLGFGLGSYLLYKLYCRFIRGEDKKPRIKYKKTDQADENFNEKSTNEEGEESDMGNSESHDLTSVSYDKAREGVTIGKHRGQRSRSKSNDRMPESQSRISKQIPVNYDERLVHSASDLNEVSPICGSLKGNLSLRSLYERNSKYGFASDDDVANQSKSFKDNLQDLKDQSNDSLQVDVLSGPDILDYSSVLLTPPSDDEIISEKSDWHDSHSEKSIEKILTDTSEVCSTSCVTNLNSSPTHTKTNVNAKQVLNSELKTSLDHPNETMHNKTNDDQSKDKIAETLLDDFDDSSEYWKSSEKSDLFKSLSDGTTDYSGSISLEDEERDMPSPLRKAKTEKQFRQSLLHRLNDYATSSPSNSTSQESTPDRSPLRRASTGCSNYSLDRQDSMSGFGTPDSELFAACDVDDHEPEQQFEEIETGIQDVTSDINDLLSQFNHLKSLGANHADTSYDITEYPSDPLAKKAREIVEKTRHKAQRSRSHSLSPSPPVGSSEHVSNDVPDLSWDSEGANGQMFHKNSANKRLQCLSHSVSKSPSVGSSVHVSNDVPDLSWDSEGANGQMFHKNSASKRLQCLSILDDNLECGKNKNDLDIPDDDKSKSESRNHNKLSVDENDLEADGCNESAQSSDFSQNLEGAASKELLQIGHKLDILEYAVKEWKGQTETASRIKNAYQEIPKLLHCCCLRQIRGDNYCGIRGTLFQCLSNGIRLKHWSSLDRTLDMLNNAYNDKSSGLKFWNFANRLPFDIDTLSQMSKCISSLHSKFEEATHISAYDERVSWTVDLLNSDYNCDLELMEGLKLLMFLNLYKLYKCYQEGEDVPVFVWLLLARDTSENPSKFVRNHLNLVGDSAGLEQVEMFLLGHTLSVTIQVIRLLQYGNEDFMSYYPDDCVGIWPQISLLAEDDRHYNVPVP